MVQRPRRNRKSEAIRNLVRETTLSKNDLLFPLFLLPGKAKKEEIKSMPGIFRLSLDLLLKEVEYCLNLGIQAFAIFPCLPDPSKDKYATEGLNPDGLYIKALYQIKKEFPEAIIMTDVAMDPYSSDGHDGLVENGEIVNDKTLEILGKMALIQAQTGIDIIGPSDMMDGRVRHIRTVLDTNGFTNTSIMSYTAKYASAYYGPFRDALDSAPKFGDKKTYQMDYANKKEALIEAALDEAEGADFLMVKPALAYLDIIHVLKENSNLPIAAYNVSGEYAMIKAAAEKGWIDNNKVILETLTSIKRAGSDVILSYFSREICEKKII
jgi:porphobilinogen synthase